MESKNPLLQNPSVESYYSNHITSFIGERLFSRFPKVKVKQTSRNTRKSNKTIKKSTGLESKPYGLGNKSRKS